MDIAERFAPELPETKSTATSHADFPCYFGSVGDALRIPEERRGAVMRSDASRQANGIMFWSAHDWLIRWSRKTDLR